MILQLKSVISHYVAVLTIFDFHAGILSTEASRSIYNNKFIVDTKRTIQVGFTLDLEPDLHEFKEWRYYDVIQPEVP